MHQYKHYGRRKFGPAYKGTKYTFSDSMAWMKFADAEEIVTEFSDRLEAVSNEYGPEAMKDMLRLFLKRAKKKGKSRRAGRRNHNVALAYKTFANEKHPEPHACINFNLELKKQHGKRIDGKTYYWTGQIGRAMWRFQFDRKS